MDMQNNRCIRISGAISDAVNSAKLRREINIAPMNDFQAVLKAAPKTVRDAIGSIKIEPLDVNGKHIESRRQLAETIVNNAGITDNTLRQQLIRTISFSDEGGRVYIPDDGDVLRLLNVLPQEYRSVAAAAVLQGLEEAVKPRNLRELERMGLTKQAEELKTRAFQAQQTLDGAINELETYMDINDAHELDRIFKKAEAGDLKAQKVVERLQQRYGVSTPQMAKAAMWADVALRNPELIADDYSDEISTRIRHAFYQTGEFNKIPTAERRILSQEFLEFALGLRHLDNTDPRLSEWLQRNNLVDANGRFVGGRKIDRTDLIQECKYVPTSRPAPSKPADETSFEEIGGVAALLGVGLPQQEADAALIRAAYSEEELQEVAEHLRRQGYSIPEGASKEEMLRAIDGFGIYEPREPSAETLLAPPPEGMAPPPTPPSDPVMDAIVPPPNLLSVNSAPKEVAMAFAALTQHPKLGFKSSVDADIAALLVRGVMASDYTGKGVSEILRSLGAKKGKITHPLNVPIAHRINERSRFFEAKETDGVYTFRLRRGANAALEAERQRLRQDMPFLNLFEDEVVDGFILAQDLGQALLVDSPVGLKFYEKLTLHRLLMYPTLENYEDLLPVFAAHFGTGSVEDLAKRFSPEWAQLVRFRLHNLVGRHRIYDAITALISRQGFVQIGNEVITNEQWDSLTVFERMALIEEIATSPEKRKALLLNFLGNEEQMERYFTGGDITRRQIDMNAEFEPDPEIYYQNPVNVASLVRFAQEMGIDPSALITGAKLLYDQMRLWDALWRRAGSYGIDMTGKVITPEGLGGNFIKSFYRMLAEKLERAGYGDAADVLFSIVEGRDVLGWDILQRVLNNEFPTELEAMFGRAVDNLGQALVLQDEFYHKAVNKNLAELLVPILAALGRPSEVIDPTTGQRYKLNPLYPMIALHPHGGSYHSLGTIVQQHYGMPKKEFYERIMRSLPTEIQETYYKLKQLGKEDTFDLYVPQILADILKGADVRRIDDIWNFLNDAYKMNLVVFSPRTIMRNFFTNLMLMSRAVDTNLWKVINEYREAFNSANQNSRLYRDLSRIDSAFSGKALYQEGSEALLFGLSKYQRWMSKLTTHRIFGAPIRLQAMAEGMGKYALMRLILKNKYGKDWERLYTQEDFYEALGIVNDWLVDYRFVPPAIDYLRRVLGFFPFITFLYTISSTLLTNPDKLTAEIIRTGRLMWYAERLATLDQESYLLDDKEEDLLPPHMRNNPLLLKWRTKEGKLYALDLTFWVPLGVFEGLTSAGVKAFREFKEGKAATPLQALTQAGGQGLLHLGEWFLSQTGSVLRPIVELMANRNLMTNQEIYQPLDPIMVKTDKILRHISAQIPLIRDAITAVNPNFYPRGKAWEEPQNWLEWIWANFLSGRKMRVDALAAQRFEQYKNNIQQYKAMITRVSRDPHLNPEQKERYIRQYLEEIERLIQEYETEAIYYLPKFYPEEGKAVYTDPLWYETIEEVLDEYEPAFAETEEP